LVWTAPFRDYLIIDVCALCIPSEKLRCQGKKEKNSTRENFGLAEEMAKDLLLEYEQRNIFHLWLQGWRRNQNNKNFCLRIFAASWCRWLSSGRYISDLRVTPSLVFIGILRLIRIALVLFSTMQRLIIWAASRRGLSCRFLSWLGSFPEHIQTGGRHNPHPSAA